MPKFKVFVKHGYVRAEGDDAGSVEETTMKLTLPRKWKEGPVSKIKNLFVEFFNKKHENNPDCAPLVAADVHLVRERDHEALNDAEIVTDVLKNRAELGIGHGSGAALPRQQRASAPGAADAARSKAAAASAATRGGMVASKEALQAAHKPLAFDHSKWDKLDLSDDDDETCHPNIEKKSWKRIMRQKRAQRVEQEKRDLKKMRGAQADDEARAGALRARLAGLEGGDEAARAPVAKELAEAEAAVAETKAKIVKFEQSRKIVFEDVCAENENRTIVNAGKTAYKSMYELAKDMGYDEYVEAHKKTLTTYAALRSDKATCEFLVEHTELLNEHAEGYLLLLSLDHEMCGRHREMEGCARQYQLMNYVIEVAKLPGKDPRSCIKPFFAKVDKKSEKFVKGFDDDLNKFIARLRDRAKTKLEKGEASPLALVEQEKEEADERAGRVVHVDDDGNEYEAAGVGPGGLDPNEVLGSLPEVMQKAFLSQDVPALEAALKSMPPAEANHHMNRCIASGLWNADGGGGGGGGGGGDAAPEPAVAAGPEPPQIEVIEADGGALD